ncbi:unnamed protein product [Plutella xylostella]|uniref:(diamondback moth) hypothetical protein n=1 Tax=Plutella xylostella TaxID=51655 RepID=A0A8S4FRM3_PLUXY|nr:unnamed protein product [Plutella xylostella]
MVVKKKNRDGDCLLELLALLCDQKPPRTIRDEHGEMRMRSFWSELLTAAASHPFPLVPGDVVSLYELPRYDDVGDDDDDCSYILVICNYACEL